MTNAYVGLDLSLTSTGMARVGGVELVDLIKPPKDLRGVARLEHVLDRVLGFVEEHKPLAIAIEGYAHGRTNQAHQLGELGGLVRVELLRRGYVVCVAAPSVLKKTVTGSGNAGKPAVAVGIFKRWAFEHASDDVTDAYGLARCIQAEFECTWPTKAMAAAWKSERVK